VLDRIYDLAPSELDWMRGIGQTVCPLVDCGAGVSVLTYPTGDRPGVRIGVGHDVEAMWARLARAVPVEIFDGAEMEPLSSASRTANSHIRRYAAVGHAAMGVRTLTSINATDLEHRMLTVGVPAPPGGRAFWPERDRTSWERISAHLGAAFRMRNHEAARQAPGLVVDSKGHLQHVAPGLPGADLARLRETVAAVDRARRVRMSPEAVLDAWRALYEGRWSIIESVERDGRRLLVARPNAPLRDTELQEPAATADEPQESLARLSSQESRVLVALSKGHSNKLIAYELGLATPTVGTLLARAARKLGCKDRVALARAGRALAHRLAGPHGARKPA